jgi:hypothetical protein
MISRSFVLGNGRSRETIDLNALRQCGKIYGCNAIYREFTPDYLIAVDPKMVYEIQETGYHRHYEVWTNINRNYGYEHGLKYFKPQLGWSSGPSALHLAASHTPNEIFILGFDFTGIDGKFNNMYANTRNYNSSESMEIYWGNWEKQTEIVVKKNPHIRFYRVVVDDFYDPGWNYLNYKNIKIEEFSKHINTFFEK